MTNHRTVGPIGTMHMPCVRLEWPRTQIHHEQHFRSCMQGRDVNGELGNKPGKLRRHGNLKELGETIYSKSF